MNMIDFLNFKGNFKDKLSKKVIFSLWFTFMCTFLTYALLKFLRDYLNISSKPLGELFLSILSKDIFLIFLIGLLFLTFYSVGTGFQFKKIYFGVRNLWKKSLKFPIEGVDINFLISNFDYQGFLNDKFDSEKCLFLNYSSEGILTKKVFKNPEIMFDAKIYLHGFAFIVGAQDFEDYVMFRINYSTDRGLYITPHIRKYGLWEIQDIKQEKEYGYKDLIEGDILHFNINSKKRIIKTEILKDGKLIKKFDYFIPNRFPLLSKYDKTVELQENVVSKLDLTCNGKVGFRAWGPDEKAIITNLEINNT